MDTQKNRRPGEVIFIASLVVFSGWALWQSWLIAGFSKLSSPGVFPMLASASMLVTSLFILLDALRKRPQRTGCIHELQQFFQDILSARLLVVLACILLYVISMPLIGFVLSSGAFLFVSFSYLWRKPLWLSLALSVFSLAIVYAVFRLVFKVVLPRGSLTGLPF